MNDKIEREIELQSNVSYYAGRAAALEGFGMLLRTKAGELYARGDKDDLANAYREIAALAESGAEEERGRQKAEQARLDEEMVPVEAVDIENVLRALSVLRDRVVE